MDDNFALIIDNLRQLKAYKGKNKFVIFQFTQEIFIQFAGNPNEPRLYGEAVSNHYLQEQELDETQIANMFELGWCAPDENSPNFYADLIAEKDSDLVRIAYLVLATAKQVYRLTPPLKIKDQVNLE
jgi:hypothetical protein